VSTWSIDVHMSGIAIPAVLSVYNCIISPAGVSVIDVYLPYLCYLASVFHLQLQILQCYYLVNWSLVPMYAYAYCFAWCTPIICDYHRSLFIMPTRQHIKINDTCKHTKIKYIVLCGNLFE